MSALALSLVRQIEANGGRLTVEGDCLVIEPRAAGISLLAELRQHKPEILDLVSSRPVIPAGVRLVRLEPKAAPFELSKWETITDTDQFIRSTLQQVEARLSGKNWLAGNWSLSTLLDRLAAVGCFVALDNPRAALQ